MMAPADETAAPLASALVRAGWPGRSRRIALSNGPAPGSLIALLDRRAFLATLGGGLLAAPLAAETFSGSCQAICVRRCRRCWRVIVAKWYCSSYGTWRCHMTKMIFNHFAPSARSAW